MLCLPGMTGVPRLPGIPVPRRVGSHILHTAQSRAQPVASLQRSSLAVYNKCTAVGIPTQPQSADVRADVQRRERKKTEERKKELLHTTAEPAVDLFLIAIYSTWTVTRRGCPALLFRRNSMTQHQPVHVPTQRSAGHTLRSSPCPCHHHHQGRWRGEIHHHP